MIEIVDEIASTSEELKRRAATGAQEAVLLARRQTAGRGRLGRPWATVEGNLHLSILLRPPHPFRPGHWSILAAVALAEALSAHAAGLRLKWPNDVLRDGGKLAGILLESGDDHGRWLVAGFGVNLASAPEGTGRAVASLHRATTPEAFAPELLAAFAGWRSIYAARGFAPLRQAWLARGPDPAAAIAAGQGGRRIEGSFAGLRDDGALLLDTPRGPVAVTSGEVE